uniref:Uncharacterized protein n=1 Tax=Ditylenchus dipsaci TaxID=166011 RepID=A0A915D5B8_9BILA
MSGNFPVLFKDKRATLEVLLAWKLTQFANPTTPHRCSNDHGVKNGFEKVSSTCSIKPFNDTDKDMCRTATWELINPIGPLTMFVKFKRNPKCKLTVSAVPNALAIADADDKPPQRKAAVDAERHAKNTMESNTREDTLSSLTETFDSQKRKEYEQTEMKVKGTGGAKAGVSTLLSEDAAFNSGIGAPLKSPRGSCRSIPELGERAMALAEELGKKEYEKVLGWLDDESEGGLTKAREWFKSNSKLNKIKHWMSESDFAKASEWLNGKNVGTIKEGWNKLNQASTMSEECSKKAAWLILARNLERTNDKPGAGNGEDGDKEGGEGGKDGGKSPKLSFEAKAEHTTKSGWDTENIKTVKKTEGKTSKNVMSSSITHELENTFTTSFKSVLTTFRTTTQKTEVEIPPNTTVGVEQLWIMCPHTSTETPYQRAYEGDKDPEEANSANPPPTLSSILLVVAAFWLLKCMVQSSSLEKCRMDWVSLDTMHNSLSLPMQKTYFHGEGTSFTQTRSSNQSQTGDKNSSAESSHSATISDVQVNVCSYYPGVFSLDLDFSLGYAYKKGFNEIHEKTITHEDTSFVQESNSKYKSENSDSTIASAVSQSMSSQRTFKVSFFMTVPPKSKFNLEQLKISCSDIVNDSPFYHAYEGDSWERRTRELCITTANFKCPDDGANNVTMRQIVVVAMFRAPPFLWPVN